MRLSRCRRWRMMFLMVLLTAPVMAVDWENFNREDYEEEAGSSFSIFAGPDREVYGAYWGFGTWLKHTPVFGDYNFSLFNHGEEHAFYTGVGLTIRIMPHWKVAPFVGGGGSYNYSFKDRYPDPSGTNPDEPEDRGDSYWGWHAEGGIRFWFENRIQLFELMGRYVRTSLDGDRDYVMFAIGTGAGF